MQAQTATIAEIKELFPLMTPEEKAEVDRLISGDIWLPIPGPQTDAYNSLADELFFGGAAGGSKTDLLLGLALTNHHRAIIFRRESTQLQGILDRLHNEILRSRDGYNGQEKIQRLSRGRQLEFGSCPNLGDEQKYQGRPHDLKAFDEICHFLESQYLFLSGWTRTTRKAQRCRIVCTGNPPSDSDGEWVLKRWGAWLDDLHPNPALPGELRWYAMIDGKDTERPDGKPFQYNGELIQPKSRTFIPSRVQDNPFLMETGYMSQLQALPEPLRSQLLNGDFRAGLGDDPWQTIPTDWVRMAQDRWTIRGRLGPMDSMGLDPSRGGADTTNIARRYGNWFDEILQYPGQAVPDGPACAALAIAALRDGAPIHIDVIGIGSSAYDHLNGNNIHIVAINGAEGTAEMDKTSNLRLRNMRAVCYWRMREALDPKNDTLLALPPDPELKADLCAPRWKLTASGILIESKEDIKKRIGRSPGKGDAAVYALISTPKKSANIVDYAELKAKYSRFGYGGRMGILYDDR